MIDFTRAFSSAWERMVIILFRPLDLGKWFVIGFSAFLAGFLSGGNGASYNNFNSFNRSGQSHSAFGSTASSDAALQQLRTNLSHALASWQTGVFIGIFLVVMIIILAVALVMYWLGSRGQFLFLDNIVRNRGAVSAPWEMYSRQANSLFFFFLLILVFCLMIFLPILGIAAYMAYPYFIHDQMPAGSEWTGFIVIGLIYFVLAIVVNGLLLLFRDLGVPLMFRNGLMARAAFAKTMNLVLRRPGSMVLFVLLRFALAIATWILGALTCCCCVGFLPYLGTVALLPALVFVRCFSLDCLAQFGPEYDVWTVDVLPGGPTAPPMFNPLQPRG